jgi:hypothetical protein
MLINGPVISSPAGRSVRVSATASSVGTTINMTGCDQIYVVNTSTTLNVAVRVGVGAQTAVLTTDVLIPPFGWIILAANPSVTHVAAIGSAAGPTIVQFSPMLRG